MARALVVTRFLVEAKMNAKNIVAAGYGAPYENLRVVSVRLDPCFGDLHPTATTTTCKNQLRLVFQEFAASGSSDHGSSIRG